MGCPDRAFDPVSICSLEFASTPSNDSNAFWMFCADTARDNRPRGIRLRTLRSFVSFLILCLLLGLHERMFAVETNSPNDGLSKLSLETDAVGPERFMAVHGRRSLIQGYATRDLEIWAYPLQIVDGYEVGFRKQGSTTEVDGAALLKRITYKPDEIIRTFIGPDFVVRESLFIPLSEPAAILTYTIDSKTPVDIVIRFTPILNLMWPGSIGGQSTRWDPAALAYVLFEPSRQFSAFVGSPDIISHDDTVNSAAPESNYRRFAFAMKAGGESEHRNVTVIVGLLENGETDPAVAMHHLVVTERESKSEAHTHYVALESSTLQIVTPDDTVNQALAWAGIALDQTWVCNPYLGCGSVAGYGPSRDARRPQYEWFFAGDGLTTISAMLAAGQYDRARETLLFIIKYQDPKTGMIWHELSQSASFLDWANRYPYMFVHVDITFQYLNTVARYLSETGDKQFVTDNWSSLQSAYDYCKSLINEYDGLPRIPATKEAGNEQDRLTDELDLSVSWLSASQSFAQLAGLAGHATEAEKARRASERARESIASRYWLKDSNRWIDGYTETGKPVLGRGISGISLIENHILNQAQNNIVLNQIASSDFQTDWGTRSIASSSPDFDPSSYAKGSVWAISTAGVASTFWTEHRPSTAFSIWSSLIPWSSLDSLGHLHEVLAGDVFHQQSESVSEQTWSSAALLSSTVHGLLGLDVDAQSNRVTFSPHLPAEWDSLRVDRVRLPRGVLTFSLARSIDGLELTIENEGSPTALRFAPEIPFGARLTGAAINGKQVRAKQEDHEQDSHAAIDVEIAHGVTRCLIHYKGGVSLSVPRRVLLPGEQSHGVKITGVKYKGVNLLVDADIDSSREATILLKTSEKIVSVKGAALHRLSNGWAELSIAPATNAETTPALYRPVQIVVELFVHRRGR